MTTTIQQFMTSAEVEAYALAASLSAAREPDRAAWLAGVNALNAAEARAIAQYRGEVKLNRYGRPRGGVHPALVDLGGRFDLSGCYAPE
ncbi:MAG: hypothetical protein ACK4ZD_06235 [Caldimonas sp.]|uniref:hypothetical protein n=1 Tax=Caldimonas sp. TaxID=2838790 RepID=UPI00391D0EEB